MSDGTPELVACNVRASPALARRIRKAVFAEQKGQDARSALMTAADCDIDELENLRIQVSTLTDNASESEQSLSSLTAKAEKCATDLFQAHTQLNERDEIVLNLRKDQTITSERIAAVENTLKQSVKIRDLPPATVKNIQAVANAVRSGDDPRSAFLAAANYDRNAVDEALSSIDRLKKINADLEMKVTPLNHMMKTGGFKAWIVHRLLGL